MDVDMKEYREVSQLNGHWMTSALHRRHNPNMYWQTVAHLWSG